MIKFKDNDNNEDNSIEGDGDCDNDDDDDKNDNNDNAVKCRYNAVWFNTISLTTLRLPRQKVNQILESHETPIPRPNERAMEGLLWGFRRKLTAL